jgi:hypothetical protein
MSDRSDEKREGYVPVGKYGWRKVGGAKGPVEVTLLGPAAAKAMAKAKERAEENRTYIPNYRTAFRDAEGRPFPREGEVRVFLDDDNEDRRAPEGWVHLRTVREVCMLILQGRVVELSLDNDLNGDVACGVGYQVIDFLEELHGTEDRPLWPRDGITFHTANPEGRNTMRRAIESLPRRLPVEVEDVTTGSKPKYLIRLTEEADS